LTGNFLAVAEVRGGTLRKVSHEVVTAARDAVKAQGGGEVHALLIGEPGIAAQAGELGRYGADRVIVVEHPALAHNLPEVSAATVAARVSGGSYRAVLFPASAQGRDLAPRVAALVRAGLAADVVSFQLDGDAVVARHPMYIGKAIATLRLLGSPALLSLRPGAIAPVERPAKAQVETAAPGLDPASARVVATGVSERAAEKLDLGEAPIVVSGGRGLKSAEHFAMLEELAGVLGNAAVGATRAVTDDGWRPATDQIGQTGRLVSPDLYFAIGISGAIQHLAGMRTSRVIVAINRDKDAPIVKLADYAIIGDLFEIVPKLIEEIRRVRRVDG
jgi:electron transfer flavoprotein alpha subunit